MTVKERNQDMRMVIELVRIHLPKTLLLCDDQKVRLVKEYTHTPGEQPGRRVLAEADCAWELDGAYDLSLTTHGDTLAAQVNGHQVFEVQDTDSPLLSGAVALVIEDGRLDCNAVNVV